MAGAMDDEDDLVDLVDGEGGAEDEDDDLGRGSEDLATDVDASSARFDEIIGSLQDLVMDASFEERQGAFGRAHWCGTALPAGQPPAAAAGAI